MNIKKRHHYIWQNYLKPWTNNNNQICCYFKLNGQYTTPNTTSIGVAKYFYKSSRLTNDDLKYLESIIVKASNPYQQKINQNWLSFIQEYYLFNDKIRASVSANRTSELRNFEQIADGFEKMLFEELHTLIESSAQEILADLRNGKNVEWTDENTMSFLFFMMNQFMRTRRQKVIGLASIDKYKDAVLKILPNWCPDRTWNIQAIILATNIGFSIYKDIRNYSFDVFESNSDYPFITGDQPILNLGNPETEEEIWMYYPLSPYRCLILQPKNNRKYTNLSSNDVLVLNTKIYNDALEQVYSHDKIFLKKQLNKLSF
tara:strand:+ start:25165 stop:26112 length:948 start_codon:yes stop_codon:yes gene_type:complete